ncbi:MAG: MATE family efflux transporter [Planctomycetia bacterium]|nr:MATE family efflux transporter [Planctomycetia bacterium]
MTPPHLSEEHPEFSAITIEPEASTPGVVSEEPMTAGRATDKAGPLLEGPIRSAVFWLSLPILGEQVLNAAIAWNDTFLAGRISSAATGAVGFASYVSWLMTMLFAMVSIGATAIVSRAIGARNDKEAAQATGQAFTLSLLVGAVGMLVIGLVAPGFARLLNLRGDSAAIAVQYLRIDSIGYIGASISFALAACLRGAGDTRTPLKVLGAVNVINLVFSWVLTFGVAGIPGLGVSGIAWGTAIARWLGALGFVVLLQRRGLAVHLNARQLGPDRQMIWRMFRVGAPASLDGLLSFSGHFIFMTIVNRVPSEFPTEIIYAAHIVGIRIESLSYLPANAFSFAASTLVGQNLGAHQPERARLCANEAVRQTMMVMVGSALLLYFGAEAMYRLLSNEPDVWRCGVPALRALAFFQIVLGPLIVYVGALRGAGDTRLPILITFFGMALVRIPGALFGGFVLQWGLLGAWLGMFADLTVRCLLIIWRFRSGKWQRIKV